MAKPRHLPFSEITTARLNAPDGLVPFLLTIEISKYFFVAQRLRCLAAKGALQLSQRPHLFLQSSLDHLIYSPVDVCIQLRPGEIEAEAARVFPRTIAGCPLRLPFTYGPAGQFPDFESADDAPLIV